MSSHNDSKLVQRIIEVALILAVLLCFLWWGGGLIVHGQISPPPMPPDLLSVDRPSCTLLEYGSAESLDAQTGQVEEITRWRVEPFATYKDHRPKWELPEETLRTSGAKRPGAIADVATDHEAIDACLAWTGAVKKAILALSKKAVQSKQEKKQ